jgi:hypothetical protein
VAEDLGELGDVDGADALDAGDAFAGAQGLVRDVDEEPAAVAERRSLPTEGEVGAQTWAPAATRGAPKRRNVDRRRETA